MIPTPTRFILTPTGLTSLALLLLTAAFFIFLAQRRPYSSASRWLLGHEASLILFLTSHLLVISAFLPFWYPVMYLSFVVGMACLLQFAFEFPRRLPNLTAAHWMRALSTISIAIELLLAIRFWLAPQNGNAHALRTIGVGMGLWQSLAALIALAYQTVRLEGSNRPAWLALILPRESAARAARNILLATLAIAALAASTLAYRLWLEQIIPEAFFNTAWSIGLMLMLAMFAVTYFVNTPDPVSFQAKLLLGTLTAVLTSVWLLSLIYPFQLQIAYDTARQADMQAVQTELARDNFSLPSALNAESIPAAVTFIAACESPAPHSINDPDLFFIRDADFDSSRLCNDDLLVGSLYGKGSLDTLSAIQSFTQGGKVYLIGFAYADYMDIMNQFSLPIALVMLGSALVIMLLLPLVFYQNLVKPLGALLAGLQQMNEGQLDVSVPIRSNDEIGLLINSFNAMAAELRASVTNLENQVAESLKSERSLREQREQLRALSTRLAEVEEAERSKLGRELHDQAGQNLTALSLTLKLVRTQLAASAQDPVLNSQLAERLDEASEIVRQTTQRIRNVMDDLQPPALDEFGLTAALRWYATHFTTRANIAVEVSSPEPAPRRLRQVEIALFRIAQEALTNVARHAQVTRVNIQIDFDGDATRMMIGDNGVGFDVDLLSQPNDDERSHWGLRIMAERAGSIGGVFRVESSPGAGTRIIVEVTS